MRRAEADSGARTDLPTSREREEIRRLRQKNFELRRAKEILESASVFRQGARRRPSAVSRYIEERRGRFGVEPICRTLPDQLWVADLTYLRCWEGTRPRAVDELACQAAPDSSPPAPVTGTACRPALCLRGMMTSGALPARAGEADQPGGGGMKPMAEGSIGKAMRSGHVTFLSPSGFEFVTGTLFQQLGEMTRSGQVTVTQVPFTRFQHPTGAAACAWTVGAIIATAARVPAKRAT